MYTFTQMEIHNNQYFYPLFCGKQSCPPGYSFGPAVREYHLIHFCLDGKGQFFSGDGTCHNIKKGQGFLIYPGDLTFYQADDDDPWTYIWIAVKGDMAERYLSLCGLAKDHPVIETSHIDELGHLVDDMLSHHESDFGNELYNQGLLYQFFSYLVDTKVSNSTSGELSDNLYISKAIDYIKANYQSQVTVQEIADYVSLNRSYLTTIFQKNVHFSPQQFLIKHRITKATELLVDTDYPIRNIAYSCGYTNEFAFTKAFKKVIGLTPSEYRRSKKVIPNNIRQEDPHKNDHFH